MTRDPASKMNLGSSFMANVEGVGEGGGESLSLAADGGGGVALSGGQIGDPLGRL